MDKPAWKTELRILLLEDVPTDAELVEDALREAGLSFTAQRVDTRETFIRALDEFKPDVVLADYSLPAFDGGSALKIIRQQYPSVPVVMVTGAVGDEIAIELLKMGARDYVLKDRLARLGPAVLRVLSEGQDILARKAAEEALRESDERYRSIFSEARDGIVLIDAESGLVVDCNSEFERQCGRTLAELARLHIWELLPPALHEAARRKFEEILASGEGGSSEADFERPDGSRVPIEFVSRRIPIGSRSYIQSISRDITERKQAEAKLAESEQHFRAVAQSANDAIITIAGAGAGAGAGNVVGWNAAAQRLFGYTEAEIMRQPLTLLMPERFRNLHNAGLARVMAGGVPHVIGKTVELAGLRKDGSEFPLELSLAQWQAADGQFFTAIIRDITERKQAEVRIQKLTRLYATLSQTNQTIVRATSRAELFSGICNAAVTHGKFVLAWVGLLDETTRMVKPVCQQGAEQGYLANIVISTDDVPAGRGPTGTAIRENRVNYVNDYATDERTLPWREAALKRSFRGAAGVPLRFKGKAIGALTLYTDEQDFFDAEQLSLLEEMATDIGYALDGFAREVERKQAEEKLLASEQKFLRFFMQMPIPLVIVNKDGVMARFNDRFTEVLGYTTDDVPTINEWWQRAYPDEAYRRWVMDTWNAAVAKAAKEGVEIEPLEYKVTGKSGAVRIMIVGGITIEDNLLATLIDITERKQAEESIRASQARFSTIFNQAPLGIALIDSATGQIHEANPRFAEIAGRTIEEMLALDWMSITHPDDVQEDLDNMALLNAGKISGFRMEKRYLRPDGSFVWINMTIAPLRGEQNIAPHHLCMIDDINERKQAESKLAEQVNELRRWHDATLGREMRTLELKHEVNELLGKSGQPPRYPSAEQDDGEHPNV